jgi:hypothetical protein
MTSMNYFDSNMSHSTITVIHIEFMLTDAGKVAHNLCDAVDSSIILFVKLASSIKEKYDRKDRRLKDLLRCI